MTDTEKLEACMNGARAALEGKKLGANPYHEDDERHWLWLQKWTAAKLEMRRPHKETR